MEKIKYLVNWGNNKETAWSGTSYSLYKALQKYYDVHDINLKINRIVDAFCRRILCKDSSVVDYYYNHLISLGLKKTKGKVFQFSEILYDKPDRDTYMYLDITMSYVYELSKSQPDIFKLSNFAGIQPRILERRSMEQDNYIRSCSGLFTMGHWLRALLIEQGFPANRVHAVGGGINIDKSKIAPKVKEHRRILFIGKDFRRKGGYITYEAFKLLRKQGEEVELYVIGPNENPINNPIDGYHFVGQISFNEEAQYYNMCDVFCMPSYFEAYGLVFIEALTFGLPCIGRNCYEMPYFIQEGETGLLLKNDDPKELASLILCILQNDNFAKNVANHQNQYLRDYSWDTVAVKMAKVIG